MNPPSTVAARAASGPLKRVAFRNVSEDADERGSPRIAHTLTACSRCRQRKTRCDPGLPRCGPCERTNSTCEYWDPGKNRNINRDYVIWLQHRVRDLQVQLERLEGEDGQEDPEAMMRNAAAVKLHETDETKFLGPSSGTQITRLVMQLAKRFTDAKTIKEIVPDAKAREVKELYAAEAEKPTSKIYPLISDVAADDLPNRGLTDLLVQLYNLKVQPMYPALHEPTFARDVDTVYAGQGNDYQNFILRMVVAVSLQKMDTQYAGLADSYYLAALKYMDSVVRPMDLRTLQCFALIAEYSLLTPTRTAIYYIMGLAVRLAQALGINEEKTISRGKGGAKADFLEIDMRRRIFWCVYVMELGLSHALGRPSILATGREHVDVAWFETCADTFISRDGISPNAPRLPTLKKWIAIHFFKMRLLQLEIRRTLYQKKRATPEDEQDPWFRQMRAKLDAWRDASPQNDEGIGLDKIWFVGRYNTMIVFLYRPSPQVPKPSVTSALECFDVCRYNLYMQREQISKGNVDLTWIFTQSLFMAINTMLWSLSYAEVRKQNPKVSVQDHFVVGMAAIDLAAERWPGVASARALYKHIIEAIMKIYDKDGDVPLTANTPSDEPSPATNGIDTLNRSRTTSPATMSSSSISTPSENAPPFGYFHHPARHSVEQPPPMPYQADPTSPPTTSSPAYPQPRVSPPPPLLQQNSIDSVSSFPYSDSSSHHQPSISYDPLSQFNPIPTQFDLPLPGWNPAYGADAQTLSLGDFAAPVPPGQLSASGSYTHENFYALPTSNQHSSRPSYDFMQPAYYETAEPYFGGGLTTDQQQQLMQTLEVDGMEDIQNMILAHKALFDPSSKTG